jgi:hypothetical protein
MYWRNNVLSFSDALAKEKSKRVVVMLGLGNDSMIGFFSSDVLKGVIC